MKYIKGNKMRGGNVFFGISVFIILLSMSFIGANDFYVNVLNPPSSVGDNFTAEIIVNTSSSDIYSAQFDLIYDSSVLNLNSISEGTFLSSDFATTIFNYTSFGGGIADNVYNVRNKTFADPNPGITGEGTIALLNFTVISEGASYLNLTNVLWVNSSILSDSASTINPVITNEEVTVGGGSGPCVINNAYWNATNALEGDVVELIVNATGDCIGETVNFTIWEHDFSIIFPDDYITSFTATYDRGTWITAYISEDFTDAVSYYFDAYLLSDPGNVVRSDGPRLDVDEINTDNVVLIEPPLSQIDENEDAIFEVRARAPNVASDIYGLQFDLVYNPGALTFNSVEEGDMLNEGGSQVTIFNYTETPGRIDDVFVIRNVTFEGSNVGIYDDEGTIAVFNFTGTNSGVYNFTLENVIWVNSTIDNVSVGVPNIEVINGTVDIVFSGNYPPQLDSIECLINSVWQPCDNLLYGDTIEDIRATCIDSDGSVASVSFVLENFEDTKNLFNGMGTQNGNVWNYDLGDFDLNDSGTMNLNVVCTDDLGATNSSLTTWSAPFGSLVPSLISPNNDGNVTQNEFFSFTSRVDCVGGECGNINATLDPFFGNDQNTINTHSTGADNKRCGIFYLGETGTVYNISQYGYSADGASCAAGIYGATSTQPDGIDGNPLLASSNQIAGHGSPASWNVFELTTPVTLDPGYYAICFVCDSSVIYYSNSSGGFLRGQADPYPFSSPYVYAAGDYASAYNLTIYATYTTGAPPAEIKSGAVSTVIGDTPFYTTDSNPSVCTNLKAGDYCETTWNVNATGENDTTHEFYTIYSQNEYPDVTQNETDHLLITIINGSVAVDNPPVVNLISPADGFDTTQTINNFVGNVYDDNGVSNVSLYIDDSIVLTNSSGVNDTNYVLVYDLSVGEYSWKIGVCDISGQCVNSSSRTINISSTSYTGCQLTNAYWGTASAVNQTSVGLTVEGSNCSGESIRFEVYEYSSTGDRSVAQNPINVGAIPALPQIFSIAGIWTTEYLNEFVPETAPPEYYFIAYIVGDDTINVTSSLPMLNVTESPPSSGSLDGILVDPTQSVNVQKDEFFNFISNVTCTGGVCSNVIATLDPFSDDDWVELHKENFNTSFGGVDGQSFGEDGWLTFELGNNGEITSNGDYALINSPNFDDLALIKTTNSLPYEYKLRIKFGNINYDVTNYDSSDSSDPDFNQHSGAWENGIYLTALTNNTCDGDGCNESWWHYNRKVVMDIDDHYSDIGRTTRVEHPFYMVYMDPAENPWPQGNLLRTWNGTENLWHTDPWNWEVAYTYQPDTWYYAEFEKKDNQLIYRLYDENENLLEETAPVDLTTTQVNDMDHALEYWYMGDPHSDDYEGNATIDDITLLVPQQKTFSCGDYCAGCSGNSNMIGPTCNLVADTQASWGDEDYNCDGTNTIEDVQITSSNGQHVYEGETIHVNVSYSCWYDPNEGDISSDSVTIWYNNGTGWKFVKQWGRAYLNASCDTVNDGADGWVSQYIKLDDVPGVHTIRVMELDQDLDWDQETSPCPTPLNILNPPMGDFGDFDDILLYVSSGAYVEHKGVVPENLGKPFYTIDPNPQSCGTMSDGEICQVSWRLNATGEPGSYNFFVDYESDDPAVFDERTDEVAINITTPCVDNDNDGYDNCTIGAQHGDALEVDCDDYNYYIHPDAIENCVDGYDNDCNGESDYDSSDGLLGDVHCEINMTQALISGGSSIFYEGDYFDAVCWVDPNYDYFNSVYAEVNGTPCVFEGAGLGIYVFNCSAGTYTGENKTVTCGINLSQSYSGNPTNTTEIKILEPCAFTNAYWSDEEVINGTTVNLIVNGTSGCDGKEVNFTVKESDDFGATDDPVNIEPSNENFIDSDLIGSWVSEYQDDDDAIWESYPPEYYFEVYLVEDPSINIKSSDPMLKVNSTNPVCGDGIVNGGEECDLLNLNGQSCLDVGFSGGNLGCYNPGDAQECMFNTSECFVDNAPVVNLVSPADLSTSTSSDVTFIGHASDDNGIVNVSLYLNGSLVSTDTSGANDLDYSFPQTLADDVYFWYLQVCDNFNQCVYSETRYVTVDTFVPDTTEPILSNGWPSGTLSSGTTQTYINVTTNEAATCRYSDSLGTAYASMTNTFSTTGGLQHSTLIINLVDGSSYNYYVRCSDTSGNINETDYEISFSVLTPASICANVDGDLYDNCTTGDPGDDGEPLIDCDDNDALEFPGQIWYGDSDSDGYGNGTQITNCSRPGVEFYAASELSTTSGDCDDNDGTIWQLLIGYPNNDGDSFYSSVSEQVCSGATLPVGYNSSQGNDCNDSDGTIYPGAPEICDGFDNQCSGDVGFGSIDENNGECSSPTPFCDSGIPACVECLVETDCGIDGWILNGSSFWNQTDVCTEELIEGIEFEDYSCNAGSCALDTSLSQWNATGNYNFEPVTTICDANFLCSDSSGGDNSYGSPDRTNPSLGYCDGAGSCDSADNSGACQLSAGSGTENGQTICVDGNSNCVDTCNDGIDNDGNGCSDGADSQCGGGEVGFCSDGIDNDCDGDTDALDPDCFVCTPGETQTCGSGACAGTQTCNALGVWDDCTTRDQNSCGACCVCENNNNPAPIVDFSYVSECVPFDCTVLDTSCEGYSVEQVCVGLNDCVDDTSECTSQTFYPQGTLCDSNFLCSNTGGGDGAYGQVDERLPSEGYCDGNGNCDYAVTGQPSCDLFASEIGQEGGTTICLDGNDACIDTCSDGINNDGDSCLDGADVDCGGTESICNDGIDNDCDGNTDAADADCFGFVCQDTDNDDYGACPNCGIANGCVADGDDCNDSDPSIYFGAPEVCGDGIDQDCDGNDLACGTCTVTGMYWNESSVEEDTLVELIIETENCIGETVDFWVYERDGFSDDMIGGGDDPVRVGPIPQSITIDSDVDLTTWAAEWQDDGFYLWANNPEYYFVAEINGVNYTSGTSSSDVLDVQITERKWIQPTVVLNPGKNSFSLPLFLNNYSIDEVFKNIIGSVDRIYTYDNGFKVRNFNGAPSNLYNLEVGKGYIIEMNSGANLVINGSKRDENLERPVVNLVPGWNFLGTFSHAYQAQDILRDITYTELYTFNGTGYELVDPTDQLSGNRSYWINVDEASSFVPLTGIVIGNE